jgi:tetratricopeptide (TPR) repeat protein
MFAGVPREHVRKVQRDEGLQHTAEEKLITVATEVFLAVDPDEKKKVMADLEIIMLHVLYLGNQDCLEKVTSMYNKLFCKQKVCQEEETDKDLGALPNKGRKISPEELYNQAMILLDGKTKNRSSEEPIHYDEEVRLLFSALEMNYLPAFEPLALLVADPFGLTDKSALSPECIKELYTKAEENDPSALVLLALQLSRKATRAQDADRVVLLLIRASHAGMSLASCLIGTHLRYHNPTNTTTEAEKWFLKAVQQGPCSFADERLALIKTKQGQFQEALDYHKKAISQGNFSSVTGAVDMMIKFNHIHEACKACAVPSIEPEYRKKFMEIKLQDIKNEHPNSWQAWGLWSSTPSKAQWFPKTVLIANKTWLLVNKRLQQSLPRDVALMICDFIATKSE